MTLTDVLKDFAYLSTLLLIGFELRRRIRIFQKYFIPSALIAGTIGMFLGPTEFSYFQKREFCFRK